MCRGEISKSQLAGVGEGGGGISDPKVIANWPNDQLSLLEFIRTLWSPI